MGQDFRVSAAAGLGWEAAVHFARSAAEIRSELSAIPDPCEGGELTPAAQRARRRAELLGQVLLRRVPREFPLAAPSASL